MGRKGKKMRTGLIVPPLIVLPGKGEVPIRCDKCGHTNFGVLAIPSAIAAVARITNLVCMTCQKIFEISPEALLGGKLEDKEKKPASSRLI